MKWIKASEEKPPTDNVVPVLWRGYIIGARYEGEIKKDGITAKELHSFHVYALNKYSKKYLSLDEVIWLDESTLSKGEGKADAAAKEKCWEENGFGIGQPEGVNAEEMKLNILIDAGQGHLFSLHERKIIFEAMEQYALSLIEQKSIFIEKLKQDIYDFYNEKHEFEKQLKEKEAEIEFLNRNSDELMENLAKYIGSNRPK